MKTKKTQVPLKELTSTPGRYRKVINLECEYPQSCLLMRIFKVHGGIFRFHSPWSRQHHEPINRQEAILGWRRKGGLREAGMVIRSASQVVLAEEADQA